MSEILKSLPFRLAALVLSAVGLALAIYFTLRQDSRFATVSFVPHAIAVWADRHGEFRNFPAYGFLTVAVLIANGRMGGVVRLLQIVGGLIALAAGLEFIQLGIATRWFEWADIWWSWAGILAGWAVWESLARAPQLILLTRRAGKERRQVARSE